MTTQIQSCPCACATAASVSDGKTPAPPPGFPDLLDRALQGLGSEPGAPGGGAPKLDLAAAIRTGDATTIRAFVRNEMFSFLGQNGGDSDSDTILGPVGRFADRLETLLTNTQGNSGSGMPASSGPDDCGCDVEPNPARSVGGGPEERILPFPDPADQPGTEPAPRPDSGPAGGAGLRNHPDAAAGDTPRAAAPPAGQGVSTARMAMEIRLQRSRGQAVTYSARTPAPAPLPASPSAMEIRIRRSQGATVIPPAPPQSPDCGGAPEPEPVAPAKPPRRASFPPPNPAPRPPYKPAASPAMSTASRMRIAMATRNAQAATPAAPAPAAAPAPKGAAVPPAAPKPPAPPASPAMSASVRIRLEMAYRSQSTVTQTQTAAAATPPPAPVTPAVAVPKPLSGPPVLWRGEGGRVRQHMI